MEWYFGIAVIFCFAYYLVILIYTGKWNSTFALFWPVMGSGHMIMGLLPYKRAVLVLLLLGWSLFLFVEFKILIAMRRRKAQEVCWVIVLGAQVRGTRITNSLKRRLDATLLFLEKYPDTRVIVSGGQGKGEDVTEAEAMSDYLNSKGIDERQIHKEDTSTSTWENLKNSSNLIGDLSQPVAVVTNNFHLYRAIRIGKKTGFSNLHGIAASSNPVLQLNYLVREFFAVLAFWLKGGCFKY